MSFFDCTELTGVKFGLSFYGQSFFQCPFPPHMKQASLLCSGLAGVLAVDLDFCWSLSLYLSQVASLATRYRRHLGSLRHVPLKVCLCH